jgi:hypothetical protein
MKLKHKIIFFLMVCLGVSSCRKNIDLKLPEYKQKVIIEASIETGGVPTVLLSYSVPFFGTFDFSNPQNAFIKGAFVTVSDGTVTDTLKELDPNTGYLYVGTKLLGQVGKTYYLNVTVSGKTYSTNTFIYNPVKLDSLYFKGEQDSLGFIWAHFSEPAGLGNNYRWFAKRLGKDQFFAAPFNSVFDDKFIDGKSFDFAYDRGPQPNEVQDYKDDPEAGWYKRGDSVLVKFCAIGRREYQFWYSYYLNKSSNGNPFSAPTNIFSMFDGEDVIGGFFGYSPSYDTLVIPK